MRAAARHGLLGEHKARRLSPHQLEQLAFIRIEKEDLVFARLAAAAAAAAAAARTALQATATALLLELVFSLAAC